MSKRRRCALALLCAWVAPVVAQSLPAPLDETTGALPPAAAIAPPAWSSLDEAARQDARARYAAWRALDDGERARIRQSQARLAALPPDQQQALRTRFDAMDQMYRDGWRLGPQLGRHYAGLQPMFGYVPQAQRGQVLDLLHALDDAQLGQLSVISQRTAPQDRARVRDDLLAQPAAARARWLSTHLAR
ncbi:DUF3106 domain-containing protein [Stenotrophomonas panacihumi]|uniref:DUF3106 domain-containing protein n=1 Tax=Stenotrophomonas panacihumi TaxID=676599 RepID=UPI0009D71E9A|nr:DUF3106 domain-containing protein [Stenotrophomonas panacihumi]PTN53489.1 DUF3106 domain-containing protein [Stenotrophomonas panacihumi]